MKNGTALMLVHLALLWTANAQVRMDWAMRYDTYTYSDASPSKAIDIDTEGHPLIVFATNGNGNLFSDIGTPILNDASIGTGLVVVKLDPETQNLIWHVRIDCDGGDRVADIAHNSDNDVYVAGSSTVDVKFYRPNKTLFATLTNPNANNAISWIVKYDKFGSPLWAYKMYSSGNVVAKGTRFHRSEVTISIRRGQRRKRHNFWTFIRQAADSQKISRISTIEYHQEG
jgi:hypothetical protein